MHSKVLQRGGVFSGRVETVARLHSGKRPAMSTQAPTCGRIGNCVLALIFPIIRDVYILSYHFLLICYSTFNSAQFDVWNIPVENHSVVMNFAFIFSMYPKLEVILLHSF